MNESTMKDENPSATKRPKMSTESEIEKSSKTTQEGVNLYSGFTLSKEHLGQNVIPILDTLPSPRDFFEQYIKPRKPCVLKGALKKAADGTTNEVYAEFAKLYRSWPNLEYLKDKAGRAHVHCEKRSNLQTRFGRAREEGEVVMPFGALIDKALSYQSSKKDVGESDDPRLYYLTTQPLTLDEEDRPAIVSSPLTTLTEDFSIRPALAGNLIPMNCNLWMGFSSKSTSGMHHDFHDNFNCVLHGKKTFVLYSPDVALEMPTNGKISKIHPNGRFWYEGDGECAPDGAELEALQAFEASQQARQAELELEAAEEAVENKEPGAEERLEKAEAAMQSALDKVLHAEAENRSEGDDDNEEQGLFGKDGKFLDKVDYDAMDDEPDESDSDEEDQTLQPLSDDMKQGVLKNFCTVSSKDVSQFAKISVDVEGGDILFLPTGWFHEVTSWASRKEKDGPEYHLAFNYWFHPPDSPNFDKPYTSQFWSNDWDERQSSTEKDK